MTFKLLGDKIAVILEDVPETTASGIVLPETAQDPLVYGKVVVVGAETEHVSDNDRIFFFKHLGREIKIDSNTYFFIAEKDVFGISDGGVA